MKHIALIFGGPSPEHDVSLVSAKNIFSVLKQTDHKVSLIGITKNNQWKLVEESDLLATNFVEPLNLEEVGQPIRIQENNKKLFIFNNKNGETISDALDLAFPIIHGPYGEDGILQQELNQMGLPFIGSDQEACAHSFDKVMTKQIIAKANIKQAKHISFVTEPPTFQQVKDQLGCPFFIKPANMGSSLGISKVSSQLNYAQAIKEALKHDRKVLIEETIIGREVECAVLTKNGKTLASGIGEIKPNHEFYSYEAKYLDPQGAELIIPASLPIEIEEKIKQLSIHCFEVLDCRHYARVDFFLTDQNQIIFNELNTYPGFTNISQFPLLWQQEGLNYKELVLQLIANCQLS